MDLFVLLMFLLIMAINWVLIYSKSPYNPNKPNAKYINIKFKPLRKILILPKHADLKYVKVKDRSKLYLPCFFGYIILTLILIITIIFYFIPEIPCQPIRLPFGKLHSVVLDTLNAKIPYTLAFIMLFLQFDFTLVSINIKIIKAKNKDATTALKIGLSIMVICSLLFIIYLLYALLK